MKFLFVITNLAVGGAQRGILNVGDGLAERGHEVHVLLLEHIVEFAVPASLNIHTLTSPGEEGSSGLLGKWRAAWRLRRLHRKLAKDVPFDLIVSTLPFADEVTRLAGLPRVWHRVANTLSIEIENLSKTKRAKARRRRARYRQVYGRSNLIAVSHGVAHDLRHRLQYHDARIEVVFNPFYLDRIRQLSFEPEPDLPAYPYILHVGRFEPQKRHDLLLDAFRLADLPHRLVLLTSASARLSTLISARQLDLKVTVAGFRKNPYPWYARADLLVLCSDREGMPNVIVEALACRTPVVSTDCPSGPREVLLGQLARWLVPPGDTRALAQRMREAVAHRPTIAEESVERFSHQHSLDAYEALARSQ
jgi:glycosyltransferase involved in cell wall biosynthesis